MRLLHTKTLELHEFFGTDIPPYAILSHTWGEGEVSLQDLPSISAKYIPGYDKIRGCCEMAASDGFLYAWVDTCCIDKTSSAELSEAINSMYSWYQLSEVCYVYLADVPANLGTKATELTIRGSRWFTRGWTLQELIAPASVIFVDSNWGELGTKETLERQISWITGVSKEVLRDADKVEEFSVAQKMSWVSRRVTTRVEDIAYCLMGIFGVHMPLLYGEGEHAFIRLQEEIMKKTADHSIFAWKSSHEPLGLFALTPVQFGGSGNWVQSKNAAMSPFSVTNKGINLYLWMRSTAHPNIWLAILDCHKIGDEMKNREIYLEKQPKQGNVFKRMAGDKIDALIRMDRAYTPSELRQENIFVKQERVMTHIPAYGYYRVSIKGLQKSGIVFRDSIPNSWDRAWNVFQPGANTKMFSHNSTKFSALRFWETNFHYGFVGILKYTTNSSIISPQASLSAKVMEYIPDLTSTYSGWSSLPEDRKAGLLCSVLENNQSFEKEFMSQSGERCYWQHPVGKWWISVIIKRGMVQDERMKTVHISWHIPKEE